MCMSFQSGPYRATRLGFDMLTKEKGREVAATADLRPWRRLGLWLQWLCITLAGSLYALCVAVITRDTTLESARTPSMIAPSLGELSAAIGLAERYIDGLYKPLD